MYCLNLHICDFPMFLLLNSNFLLFWLENISIISILINFSKFYVFFFLNDFFWKMVHVNLRRMYILFLMSRVSFRIGWFIGIFRSFFLVLLIILWKVGCNMLLIVLKRLVILFCSIAKLMTGDYVGL